MRGTYITAAAIALLLGLWLYSGWVQEDDQTVYESIAQLNRDAARIAQEAPPTRVRAAIIEATERERLVTVRGKTEAKRTVAVRVELGGRITNRPVERGDVVDTGDVLCTLSTEDRRVAVDEATAALAQARIDYEGALRLKEKGFNSQSAIAAAKARLASADAELSRRKLDLAKLQVRAPFPGMIEDVHQEIGDFVSPGAACATVVDLDPMLLVGRVSEQDVVELSVGQPARGLVRGGRIVEGPVTFVGQQNDPSTRTYPIEIQVPNADLSLRSGITTEIHVPVENVLAQKITPALFTLDDDGAIGVRTVDADNTVQFYLVSVLADDVDGVWVTGLPNRVAVITVGQELVVAGERVDPVFEGDRTLQAETPTAPDATAAPPPAPAQVGMASVSAASL